MLVSNAEAYQHLSNEPCPHCKHRRDSKITISWMMHGTKANGDEATVNVVMCDACAVRLARGIMQDVDNSMIRTNLLPNKEIADA